MTDSFAAYEINEEELKPREASFESDQNAILKKFLEMMINEYTTSYIALKANVVDSNARLIKEILTDSPISTALNVKNEIGFFIVKAVNEIIVDFLRKNREKIKKANSVKSPVLSYLVVLNREEARSDITGL